MKKLKTRLSIVLAVMMVFTFMPSMAFATVTWSDDYQSATSNITNHVPMGVDVNWTAVGPGVNVLKAITTAPAPSYGDTYNTTDVGTNVNFYDASGAYFVKGTQKLAPSMSKEDFDALFTGTGLSLVLVAPTYAKNYNATAPQTDVNPVGNFSNNITLGKCTFEPKVSGYDPNVTKADQDVTISFEKTYAQNTYNYMREDTYDVLNGIAPVQITVKGAAYTQNDAKFAWDEITSSSSNSTASVQYDGSEHTIVWNEVPGFSVQYTKYNKSTGKTDNVTEIKATDVLENTNYGAIVYATNDPTNVTKQHPYQLRVNVTAAGMPSFGFDADGNVGNYSYSVSGTEYDPYDFIVINANTTGTDVAKAANKAAAKANEDLLKQYVKDFYNIEAKAAKATPDYFKLSLEPKKLTDAEKKELVDKYKQMLANFGFTASTDNVATAVSKVGPDAHVTVNAKSSDYEVTFTKAVASKTYKGSKTTKKGKLKKNQTIQFTAEAANGVAVSYKLINVNTSKIKIDKATGKVTVKKGLAKGTYKFKVKAYVPGFANAYEIQNVTLKLKK